MKDYFYINTSVGSLRLYFSFKFENRPVIVFLHDSLGCIELWRDLPERLGNAALCNVLIYDRQGYGKSCDFSVTKRNTDYMEIEAEILNELLNALKIDMFILFGHSDGGTISLIYGAKYPEKVSGIITVGAHIFVEEITLSGIKKVLEIYKTTDLKSRLEKYHSDKTETMFYAWVDTWLSEEFRNWSIEKSIPLIKCPVLVIQGDDDEFGSQKQVAGIINNINGISKQIIIPESGHNPHQEKPDLVLPLITEFIEMV
jgi:pimeloyl-ACP methyl ester carboxylesterase